MWKIDQNEMAETRARANMIRKKEEYAKDTAAAAAAAINGNTLSRAKHTRDYSAERTSNSSTWSYPTASQSVPQQYGPPDSPGLPRPPASPCRTPPLGGTPHGGTSSPRGVVQSPPRDQQLPQQGLGADASPKQRFSTESAVLVSDSGKISKSKPSAHKRAVSQWRDGEVPPQIVLPSSAGEAMPQQLIPQDRGGHRSSKSLDLRPNDAVSSSASPGADESELMGIIHEERNEDNDGGDGDGHLPLPPTLAGWDERSTPSGEKQVGADRMIFFGRHFVARLLRRLNVSLVYCCRPFPVSFLFGVHEHQRLNRSMCTSNSVLFSARNLSTTPFK